MDSQNRWFAISTALSLPHSLVGAGGSIYTMQCVYSLGYTYFKPQACVYGCHATDHAPSGQKEQTAVQPTSTREVIFRTHISACYLYFLSCIAGNASVSASALCRCLISRNTSLGLSVLVTEIAAAPGSRELSGICHNYGILLDYIHRGKLYSGVSPTHGRTKHTPVNPQR